MTDGDAMVTDSKQQLRFPYTLVCTMVERARHLQAPKGAVPWQTSQLQQSKYKQGLVATP